jgi:hypothetical protein
MRGDGTRQSERRNARVLSTLRLIAENEPITMQRVREMSPAAWAVMVRFRSMCWVVENDENEWSLTPEGREALAHHEAKHRERGSPPVAPTSFSSEDGS